MMKLTFGLTKYAARHARGFLFVIGIFAVSSIGLAVVQPSAGAFGPYWVRSIAENIAFIIMLYVTLWYRMQWEGQEAAVSIENTIGKAQNFIETNAKVDAVILLMSRLDAIDFAEPSGGEKARALIHGFVELNPVFGGKYERQTTFESKPSNGNADFGNWGDNERGPGE